MAKKKTSPQTKGGGKRVSKGDTPSPFRRELAGLISFFLGLFSLFGYFNTEAVFIEAFASLLKGLIGVGFWLYAPVFFVCSYILMCHRGRPVLQRVTCAFLIPIFFSCLCYGFIRSDNRPDLRDFMGLWDLGQSLEGSGVVGSLIGGLSTMAFTGVGTIVVFFLLTAFLVLGTVDRSIMDFIDWYAARPPYEPKPKMEKPVKEPKHSATKISSAKKSRGDVLAEDAPKSRKRKRGEEPFQSPKDITDRLPDERMEDLSETSNLPPLDIPEPEVEEPLHITPEEAFPPPPPVKKKKLHFDLPSAFEMNKKIKPKEMPPLVFPEKLETSLDELELPTPANLFPEKDSNPDLENDVFSGWDHVKIPPPVQTVPTPLMPKMPILDMPSRLSIQTPEQAEGGFFKKEKTVPYPDELFSAGKQAPRAEPSVESAPLPEAPVMDIPMDTTLPSESVAEPVVTLPVAELLQPVSIPFQPEETPVAAVPPPVVTPPVVTPPVAPIANPVQSIGKAVSPIHIQIADDPSMRTIPPSVQEEPSPSEETVVSPPESATSPIETTVSAPESATFPIETTVSTPETPTFPVGTTVSTPEVPSFPVGTTVSTPETPSFPMETTVSTPEAPSFPMETTVSTPETPTFPMGTAVSTPEAPTFPMETAVSTPEVASAVGENNLGEQAPVATEDPPVRVQPMNPEDYNPVIPPPVVDSGFSQPYVPNMDDPPINSGFTMPIYTKTEEESLQIAKEIQAVPTVAYQPPPLSLLKQGSVSDTSAQQSELEANRQRLEDTLNSFSINASIQQVTQGPSVTRYEVILEQGVKLSKIVNLSDDIALALGATGVRIAPIPQKISMVGIEVPNKSVTPVEISTVIGSANFLNSDSRVSFAVGKDINGSAIVGNIAKFPHLLVAGTTGSGKSVCTNSLIISLLYKASPEEVRLIMVDPKMVELQIYNGIPHLLIPVVTDPKKAAGALQWAVVEMMKRYRLFSEVGTRDLTSYNKMAETRDDMEKMPQIVVVIDELADLMLVAAKEVEESICRVAQMGRASGMHLIVATQRPSADVITGLMKANIPSRISFAVSSGMESRIILDTQGAEKLVGRGDMLYAPLGEGKPTRVQGCLISDSEVAAVVDYVKQHNTTASYSNEIMEEIDQNVAAKEKNASKSSAQPSYDDNEQDEMLDSAIEVVLDMKQASTSMIQRRLKLGYARAARIVDQMEDMGIVGPSEGSKPRQLLISKEQWQEMQFRRGGGSAPVADTPSPKTDSPPWTSSSSEDII